jgi:hypothetical protein
LGQKVPGSGRRGKILWVLLGCALFVLLSLTVAQLLPRGIDWYMTFRPATLAFLSGQSPYDSPALQAPMPGAPWSLLPLLPLAVLPEQIGRGFLLILSLAAFAYAAFRLGAKPVALAAFILSPPVLHCLLNANLDWMPVLGFVLPPAVGLFFLAVKPQMGSIVALFWFVEAWRRGGWKEAARVFGPVSAAFALSLIAYGFWPVNMLRAAEYTLWWNASLWPASIPVGLGLAVAALRRRNVRFAMAASPCLSPHVLLHSWSGALISIAAFPWETIATVIGLWILVLLQGAHLGGAW